MGTLPDSPLNLEAEPGHEEVRLSWEDPDDSSIDKYQYSIDGVTNSTTNIECRRHRHRNTRITGYTVSTNGTTYTFQIRAVERWAKGTLMTNLALPRTIDAKPLPPQLLRPDLEAPGGGQW